MSSDGGSISIFWNEGSSGVKIGGVESARHQRDVHVWRLVIMVKASA